MKQVTDDDWDKAMKVSQWSHYGHHRIGTRTHDLGQSLYAAYLLYILSLMFSKLSLAVFIRSLTPASKDKWLARGVEAIVYLWALAAFFGSAFQCSVPRTWDFWNGQCFNVVCAGCTPDALLIDDPEATLI